MTHHRAPVITVIGDDTVAGHGDPRGLGWAGRVAVQTRAAAPDLRFYQLGCPEEDTGAFSQRCMAEAGPRFRPEADNRLVLAPGSHDIETGLSTARSRLNLANVLDAALKAEVSTFVVGPAPRADAEHNRRLAELNAGFSEVAQRRTITYVDMFTPLLDHPGWMDDLRGSATGFPSQVGHGLLAWLVLNRGWFDWLGITPPADS